MKKTTYADVASEITAKQKKYQGIIDSQDTTNLEKKTAQMNLQQLNAFADEVFNAMEEDKRGLIAVPQKFARGGQVDPRLLAWLPGQPVTAPMIQGSIDVPQDFSVSGRGDLSGLYASRPQIAPTLPYAPDRSIQPLESTSSAQFQSMNNSIQDPGGFDPSSVAGYIIPGMNMARGIFGKAKELDPNDYRITKKIAPMRMDVTPQLEGVDSQAAITKRNIRSGSPTQIMSGNIATSDWATRAKAGIYGNKWNADQQSRQQSQLLDLENERNNIQMELQIGDMNDRAKAAKENLTSTGMSQMLESYYRDRNDATIQRQLEQDQAQFEESTRQAGEMTDKYLANARETSERNYNLELQRMANELGDSKLARESAEKIAKINSSGGGGGLYNPQDYYQQGASPYDAGKLIQIALNYTGEYPGMEMNAEERRIVDNMRKDKRIMTDWMLNSLPNKPKDKGTEVSARDYLWNDYQRYGKDGGKAVAAYVLGRDKFDKILNIKGDQWREDPDVQKALAKINTISAPSYPGTTMAEATIKPRSDFEKGLIPVIGVMGARAGYYTAKFIGEEIADKGSEFSKNLKSMISKIGEYIYGDNNKTSVSDVEKTAIKERNYRLRNKPRVSSQAQPYEPLKIPGTTRMTYSNKTEGWGKYFDASYELIKAEKGLVDEIAKTANVSAEEAKQAISRYKQINTAKGFIGRTGKEISKSIGRLGRSVKVAAPTMILDILSNIKIDNAIMERYNLQSQDDVEQLKKLSGEYNITLDEAYSTYFNKGV